MYCINATRGSLYTAVVRRRRLNSYLSKGEHQVSDWVIGWCILYLFPGPEGTWAQFDVFQRLIKRIAFFRCATNFIQIPFGHANFSNARRAYAIKPICRFDVSRRFLLFHHYFRVRRNKCAPWWHHNRRALNLIQSVIHPAWVVGVHSSQQSSPFTHFCYSVCAADSAPQHQDIAVMLLFRSTIIWIDLNFSNSV